MLDLRSSSFQNLTTMPGCISSKVPSNISIYGISLIVKRELGPCALNVRIYHQKEEGTRHVVKTLYILTLWSRLQLASCKRELLLSLNGLHFKRRTVRT